MSSSVEVVFSKEICHSAVHYFGLAVDLRMEGCALFQFGVHKWTPKVGQEMLVTIEYNGTPKAEVCPYVLDE